MTSCATNCRQYGEDLFKFVEGKRLSDRAIFNVAVNHAVMLCQRFDYEDKTPEEAHAESKAELEHLITGTPSLRVDEQQWVISHFASSMADCVRPPCAVPHGSAFRVDETVARRAAQATALLRGMLDASRAVVSQRSAWGLEATPRGEALLQCLATSVPNRSAATAAATLNVVPEGPSDGGKSDLCNALACDKHAPTNVDACTILPIRYRHQPGARGWSMQFPDALVRLHARVQLAIGGAPCGSGSVAVGAIPSLVSSPTEYYNIVEAVNQELRCFFAQKQGHSRMYDELLKDMQAIHVANIMPTQISSWSSFAGSGGSGGGFDVSYTDISGNDDSASTSEIVRRWRLEAQTMGDVVVVLSKEAYVGGSTKHHAARDQLQLLLENNPALQVLLIPTYLSRSTVDRTCEEVLDSFGASLFDAAARNATSTASSAVRGFCVEPYCARKMHSLFTGTPGVDTTANILSRFGRTARHCFSLMGVEEPKNISTCDDVQAVVNASLKVYAKAQNEPLLLRLQALQAEKVEALAASSVAQLRACVASAADAGKADSSAVATTLSAIAERERSITTALNAYQQEQVRLQVQFKAIRSNASKVLRRLPQWVHACASGTRVGEGIFCRSLIPASHTERMTDVFRGNVTPIVDSAGRAAMLSSMALLAKVGVSERMCDGGAMAVPSARLLDPEALAAAATDDDVLWYDMRVEWEALQSFLAYVWFVLPTTVVGGLVVRWVDRNMVKVLWGTVVVQCARCRVTPWRTVLTMAVLLAGYMAFKYHRRGHRADALGAWVLQYEHAMAADMASLLGEVQRCAVRGIVRTYADLVDDVETTWKRMHLEEMSHRAVLEVASPMPTLDVQPVQDALDALPPLLNSLGKLKHLMLAVLKLNPMLVTGLGVSTEMSTEEGLHPTLATIASLRNVVIDE